MKRFITFVTFLILLITGVAFAQVQPQTWIFSGGTIKPANSSWTLTLPYLPSQPCIGTNSNGLLQAGTCSGGTGTVTQINTTFPITGGPITTTGTISWGGISTSSNLVDGQALYATGVGTFASTATTTASCSGNTTCTSFTIFGSTPVTISSTGGGTGSGTVATSTHETQGGIAYWTSNSATPALLGEVATTSLGVSAPITFSGTLFAQIGGTGGSFGCTTASVSAAGCISVPSFNLFNNKVGTSTHETQGQLAYWTTTSGTPATVGEVATSSVTFSSPLSTSGTIGALVGGTALTVSCPTCNTSAASVTSVGLSTPNSTLTLGGTNPVTTSGTISADLNLTHANSWTGLQQFANASSTLSSVFKTAYFGGTATTTINADGSGSIVVPSAGSITDSSLGTAAGTIVAADPTGRLIATTTPGGSSLTGSTGQVAYFSGTNAAVGTSSIFVATTQNVGVSTTSPFAQFSVVSSSTLQDAFAVYSTTTTMVSHTATTTLTSSGTFTLPSGTITAMNVYVFGGGGGGGSDCSGGCNTAPSGGGGGGGASSFANLVYAGGGGGGSGNSSSYNIGAGGGGGYEAVSFTANQVTNLGSNSFSVTVGGGGGGGTDTPTGGTGGAGNGSGGAGYANSGGGGTAGGGGGGASTNGTSGAKTTPGVGGANGGGSNVGNGQSTGGSGFNNSSGTQLATGTGVSGSNGAGSGGSGAGGGTGLAGGAGGSGGSTCGTGTQPGGGGGSGTNSGAGAPGCAGGAGQVVVVVNYTTITLGGSGTLTPAIVTTQWGDTGFGTSTPTSTVSVAGNETIGADYEYQIPTNSLAVEGSIYSGTSTAHIGTQFVVSSLSGIVSSLIYQIIGSTQYITDEIDSLGHLITGGPAPTCGTGCASVMGDDRTMEVITGSSVSSVTVNFANSWAKHPICQATDESGVSTGVEASTTVSTVILTLPTALTSKNIGVSCQSSNNFTY